MYGVWVAFVPLFVVDVVKRPGSWAGIVLAAFAAGTGATLLIGGRWADRRGRWRPVLVGSPTVAVARALVGPQPVHPWLRRAVRVFDGAARGVAGKLLDPIVFGVVGAPDLAHGRPAHFYPLAAWRW